MELRGEQERTEKQARGNLGTIKSKWRSKTLGAEECKRVKEQIRMI